MIQRFTRRACNIASGLARRCQIPITVDDRKLASLRNIHAYRRCFVVGNGPSLRMTDLDRLAKEGEICLGSNKIYLAFDNTNWRPTYYGIEDTDTASRSRDEINSLVKCKLIYANYLRPIFGQHPEGVGFHLLPRVCPPNRPRFAVNLLRGIYCGGTISYSLIQIARWLGCSEVYLLGVDFSYQIGNAVESQAHTGYKEYTYRPGDHNQYFSDDYLKAGDSIVAPDLEASLLAYESAHSYCQSTGSMKVYNATRGGKLEVFPRVKFDSLF